MQTTDVNVWVNGCFDVLHIGHIKLLEYAKSLGNKLIVGIDSDIRIKTNKSFDRPYNCFENRKLFLESIKFVDQVCVFNTDQELENLIKNNNISIMVVGSDWKDKNIIGQQFANQLYFFDRIANHSTTNILKNIK